MVNGKSLLLVDDDDALRESLRDQLQLHEEFVIQEANSGSTALDIVKDSNYDLVILDVGLPDMDGREVCRLMRRAGVNAPIIMLTGADTEADTILGLDSGANDYVTKPFKLGVLLARIRAQLRQHERSEDAVFNIGHTAYLVNCLNNNTLDLLEYAVDDKLPQPQRGKAQSKHLFPLVEAASRSGAPLRWRSLRRGGASASRCWRPPRLPSSTAPPRMT